MRIMDAELYIFRGKLSKHTDDWKRLGSRTLRRIASTCTQSQRETFMGIQQNVNGSYLQSEILRYSYHICAFLHYLKSYNEHIHLYTEERNKAGKHFFKKKE